MTVYSTTSENGPCRVQIAALPAPRNGSKVIDRQTIDDTDLSSSESLYRVKPRPGLPITRITTMEVRLDKLPKSKRSHREYHSGRYTKPNLGQITKGSAFTWWEANPLRTQSLRLGKSGAKREIPIDEAKFNEGQQAKATAPKTIQIIRSYERQPETSVEPESSDTTLKNNEPVGDIKSITSEATTTRHNVLSINSTRTTDNTSKAIEAPQTFPEISDTESLIHRRPHTVYRLSTSEQSKPVGRSQQALELAFLFVDRAKSFRMALAREYRDLCKMFNRVQVGLQQRLRMAEDQNSKTMIERDLLEVQGLLHELRFHHVDTAEEISHIEWRRKSLIVIEDDAKNEVKGILELFSNSMKSIREVQERLEDKIQRWQYRPGKPETPNEKSTSSSRNITENQKELPFQTQMKANVGQLLILYEAFLRHEIDVLEKMLQFCVTRAEVADDHEATDSETITPASYSMSSDLAGRRNMQLRWSGRR